MTEEEYFRKNYPDSCYGDKPLSPYWDFFQDGVEFGERESKEKIAELKERNAELKGMYAHSAREAETYKQFLKLKEKENAELREQLGEVQMQKAGEKSDLVWHLNVIDYLGQFCSDYPDCVIEAENIKGDKL